MMLAPSPASAQSNFELVSEEDIKVYYEKPVFLPDSRISGSFHFLYTQLTDVSGDIPKYRFKQKFFLNFSSEVHRDALLFVSLSNKDFNAGEEGGTYRSYQYEERRDGGSSADSEISAIVDQAYLNFFSNPCNGFKIGLQRYEVGGVNSLLYKGRGTALRNQCTLGTWPYDIGISQIGERLNASIKWGQITYPVYENGQFEENLNLKGKYTQSALYFDFYRVNYSEYAVPLSFSGGQTWSPRSDSTSDYSPYHVPYDDGRYVYQDVKNEYYGASLRWHYYRYKTSFEWMTMSGKTRYYAMENSGLYGETGGSETLASQAKNYGLLYRWTNEFFPSPNVRIFIDWLYTSGNNPLDETSDVTTDYYRYWERENTAFRTISNGTFNNEGRTYFNSKGLGQAHSISNLRSIGAGFGYTSDTRSFSLGMTIYRYMRTQDVYDSDGNRVNDIGTEIALLYDYYFRPELMTNFFVSYFSPNKAYTLNENLLPNGAHYPSVFYNYGLSIDYSF